METDLRTNAAAVDIQPAVSWAAVAAGAVGTAALSLLLVAFGAGLGFSAISPWSDTGVSAATFQIGTGVYLVIISVTSSAIGGYLAALLFGAFAASLTAAEGGALRDGTWSDRVLTPRSV